MVVTPFHYTRLIMLNTPVRLASYHITYSKQKSTGLAFRLVEFTISYRVPLSDVYRLNVVITINFIKVKFPNG